MDRLQAMRVFVRVAELGSFARAADDLDLSRARVSEAVADLERALGRRLVHRTTRRLSLSDDGRAYYDRCAQILSDIEEADALVTGSRTSARGRLRVDMPMALARLFVIPALPKLLAQHPELAIELRLENRSIDLLQEGVDCALSYGKPTDEDLVARHVASTRLLTCASPSYLRRRGTPTHPSQLEQHDRIAFLGLLTSRPSEWLFIRESETILQAPGGNLAFNSMEACVQAAEAGLGVTQVLSALAHAALSSGTVKPVLKHWTAAGPSLYLVYPPNRQLSARLRVFVEFVSEIFARANLGAAGDRA